jgi:ADP-heptose:LPS heptosyltransferase
MKIIDVHFRNKHSRFHRVGDCIQMSAIVNGLQVANPGDRVRAVVYQEFKPWIDLCWKDVVTVESGEPLYNEVWPYVDSLWCHDDHCDAFGMTRLDFMAENAGCRAILPTPMIAQEALDWAKSMVGDKKVAVIVPFCNCTQFAWATEHYKALGNYLTDKYEVIAIKLASEPEFEFGGKTIEDTTPQQTAALFLMATLMIGNDAGLTHLGGILNVPTWAICGPTKGKVVFGNYPSVKWIDAPDGLSKLKLDEVIKTIIP